MGEKKGNKRREIMSKAKKLGEFVLDGGMPPPLPVCDLGDPE